MTMGVGGALMEDLAVDRRLGFFVNTRPRRIRGAGPRRHPASGGHLPRRDRSHDLANEGKGVGELGLCGVSAAIANAIPNATGIRVRDYPITLDKLIEGLPDVA